MNSWGANSVPGNATGHADGSSNNGAFNPTNPDQNSGAGSATIDPSVAFFNPSPLPQHSLTPTQQAQAQQRMFNGANLAPGGPNARNMSPGFHAPASVIPTKRPRPEDMGMPGGMNMAGMHGGMPPNMGMMMSPRPPNMGSPSLQFPGAGNAGAQHGQMQGGMNGASSFSNSGIQTSGPSQPSHPPTPYGRLQNNASGNASPNSMAGPGEFDPSNMSNMGGNQSGPAGLHQRMPSASPFSPANMATLGNQMQNLSATAGGNLPGSDHPSRTGTPQNAGFPQGMPFHPGQQPLGISPGMQASQYIPGVGGAAGPAGANMAGGFGPGQQGMNRQARQYQLQLLQQTKQMQNAAQAMSAGSAPGGMGMLPRNQNPAGPNPAMNMPMGMNSNMNMPAGGPAGQGNIPGGAMLNMPGGNAGAIGMNPSTAGAGPAGALPSQTPSSMNPQLGSMRQVSAPSPSMGPQQNNTPEAFVQMLQRFMAARNQPFDMTPTACGRPIPLFHLWAIVSKMGGSKKVMAMNSWHVVAAQLSLNPAQFPSAPNELRDIFIRNLSPYEAVVARKQSNGPDLRQQATQVQMAQQQAIHAQKRQMLQQQQRQQQHLQQMQQQQQRAQAQGRQPQQGQMPGMQAFSPPPPSMASQPQQQQSRPQQRPQSVVPSSVGQSPAPMPKISGSEAPSINGPYGPQTQMQNKPPSQIKRGSSLSRPTGAAPSPIPGQQQQPNYLQPSPAPDRKPSPSRVNMNDDQASNIPSSRTRPSSVLPSHGAGEAQPQLGFRRPLKDQFQPTVLPEPATHGPINVDDIFALGDEIARFRPTVPRFHELGVIDIHALTMGVRSGIHAEMRHSLDTLATVTSGPNVHLTLESCPELVEALVECGEDQADLLAENAAEIEVSSDAMVITPYEEVLAGCHAETIGLRDCSAFGTLDYDLDKSVERLICVTSILRNLSFAEHNFRLLSAPLVIKFIAGIIQVMGTRNMLLRTYQNALDLMKDLIVFLSNIAHAVEIPGREEAVCLLAFLLAFAPTGSDEHSGTADGEKAGDAEDEEGYKTITGMETMSADNASASSIENLTFPSYNPSLHRYLPLAVDALAKLLARDDPNRTLFKAVFAQDSASFSAWLAQSSQQGRASQPTDLLSRTFALAICPLPSPLQTSTLAPQHLLMLIEVRKALLMQSLLAADVLASMLSSVAGGSGAPADVARMARAWLGSVDGWASALGRVVMVLLDSVEKTAAATASANNARQSGRGHAANVYSGQQQGSATVDESAVSILNRGLSVLRRLTEHTETRAPSRTVANAEPAQTPAPDDRDLINPPPLI
ncbi:ARID/BRIGHT DNA-binding domain protein [Ascosphaera apis ARSEF 7405]|uniref:ARID/BRIGHT DNA-binding domain protein n=1 Tax=Ascosphaera apis ARSEF 7405 TaxID=392613 RepID=A0A162IK00_9EURO|nr:ARID/BRIGHT DNA-binding domain protein [Ascosphaera apis ARSEF 7405]